MNEILHITCLHTGQQPKIPAVVSHLPQKIQHWYLMRNPYIVLENGTYCLQTNQECCYTADWREQIRKLLTEQKQQGKKIVCSPLWAELPHDILPIANGQIVNMLFMMQGIEEALRRRGIAFHDAYIVLADDGEQEYSWLRFLLPQWCNHFGIWTDRPQAFATIQEEFLFERGLVVEVFSSLGYTTFRQSDLVLSFKKTGTAMVYALKEHCILFEFGQNLQLIQRLHESRSDVVVITDFLFCSDTQTEAMSSAKTEAIAYCQTPIFAQFYKEQDFTNVYHIQQQMGVSIAGFCCLQKRCKIGKNTVNH